jgi:hypothetical protein
VILRPVINYFRANLSEKLAGQQSNGAAEASFREWRSIRPGENTSESGRRGGDREDIVMEEVARIERRDDKGKSWHGGKVTMSSSTIQNADIDAARFRPF